jgi:hypothetical protein
MLGKITLVAVVIYIILWGMGSYEYLDAPRQAFTVLIVLLAFIWIGKLILARTRAGKSTAFPSLKWKGI